MVDAISYEEMLRKMKEKYGNKRRIVGILFTRPTSNLAENEILKSLNYYHHRSGEDIDFYLPGYGAYWNNDYPDGEVVCNIDGTKWSFSTKEYAKFIEKMSKNSKWKYNGESELILVDFVEQDIDYSNTVSIELDQAIRDKAIVSISNFFEKIFMLSNTDRSAYSSSDILTLNNLRESISDELKNKFWLYRIFNKAKYFTVKNYNK